MANVTKVIQLPAPVQLVPNVERWGIAQLQFNPITETASALLVAVDANGAQIAGGASKSFGVSGAQYRALFSDALASSLVGLITQAGIASGQFAQGSTVVDV